MIIAFEGLDGVGKSTASMRFSKEYGFKRIERPIYSLFGIESYDSQKFEMVCELEDKVYNNCQSSLLKASLTGLGLVYLHKVLFEENIVLDRALLSNFSYNGTEETMPLFEAMLKMNVYPDITFLLYASDKTRKKRIIGRDPNDPDLYNPEVLAQSYEKIFSFVKKYDLPIILIDTENKTPDEVYDEINEKYIEFIKDKEDTKSSKQYKIKK